MAYLDDSPDLNRGASLRSLLASFSTSLVVCILVIFLSFLLKPRYPKVFPLAYVDTVIKNQVKAAWPRSLLVPLPEPSRNDLASFDNHLFDRYLHTLLRMFLVLTIVILPILVPLNTVGGKGDTGGVHGLHKLSFSNVGLLNAKRYWAHLLLAMSASIFIGLTVRFELLIYYRLRKLLESDSSWYTCTIMITTSQSQLSGHLVHHYLKSVPGVIVTVQMNRDYGSLHSTIQKRNEYVFALEIAETLLIRKANAIQTRRRYLNRPGIGYRSIPLDASTRPHMRLPVHLWVVSIPIGTRVDAIKHLQSEIIRHNLLIRRQGRDSRGCNSAFVTFSKDVSSAAMKNLSLPPNWSISRPPAPEDIIWQNISSNKRSQIVRRLITDLLVTLLIVGIALLVSTSQIIYLADAFSSLTKLNTLPKSIVAFLQGALFPALVISLIGFVVPQSLRALVRFRRHHSQQDVEKSVQREYPDDEEQAENFVRLLQEVREAFHTYSDSINPRYHFEITVASPAGLSNYQKLKLPEMDPFIDSWNIMAYDYSGPWSNVTAHQANIFSANDSTTPFDTDTAVRFYISKGIAVSKIVIGMPLYGRIFRDTLGLGQSFEEVDSGAFVDDALSVFDLPLSGTTEVDQLEVGGSYCWDSNKKSLISYDSLRVATLKAEWIQSRNLGGAMWWESSRDRLGENSTIRRCVEALSCLQRTENMLNYPDSGYINVRRNSSQRFPLQHEPAVSSADCVNSTYLASLTTLSPSGSESKSDTLMSETTSLASSSLLPATSSSVFQSSSTTSLCDPDISAPTEAQHSSESPISSSLLSISECLLGLDCPGSWTLEPPNEPTTVPPIVIFSTTTLPPSVIIVTTTIVITLV